MAKKIVILGGGTGGTLMANRLRKAYDRSEVEITVVDKDDRHVYQPGLLFVPFGLARQRGHRSPPASPVPRRDRVPRGPRSTASRSTTTASTSRTAPILPYDVLIVATGTRLAPEETEGLEGPGWMERVFTFYTPEGSAALAEALERFDGGTTRREHRRHADQVPRRADRVRVPR